MALCALLFCFVIVVPFLRDRINRMFDDNGQRRQDMQIIEKDKDMYQDVNGDSKRGALSISVPDIVRHLWNKIHPSRAVIISESDSGMVARVRR